MAAMFANDIVGFEENKLKAIPTNFMPRGLTISLQKFRIYVPGYENNNLNGGAICMMQCYNTERLLLSFLIAATQKNYCR